MGNYRLQDHCKINTNENSDTFVGIQCKDGELCFNFPMGFPEPKEDDDYRKDIILVLNSIATTVGRRDSELLREGGSHFVKDFPLQAYFFLIADYIEHGYYRETDICFRRCKKGKIDWRKTIKRINPCFQEGNAVYLDYITRFQTINEDEMITLIHKYCVYESFERVGWIFTNALPECPKIKFNHDIFKKVVSDKLNQTFNDEKRRLFTNMLSVIDREQTVNSSKNYMYGTNRYEYVWEKMIDSVFGISDKYEFFPQTHWIIGDKVHDNASLEPDSIMFYGKDVYVLDAKYYKYGLSNLPKDLPESTSINKQITYGEYIVTEPRFKKMLDSDVVVYNAFLMPTVSEEEPYKKCAIAYSDWKTGENPYEKVVGVLIDLKHLLVLAKTRDRTEIPDLAEVIYKAIN